MKRTLTILALLLLTSGAASASRADDGILSVELGDDLVGTFPSTNATTTVRVHNAGLSPMIVALSAANATGGVNVTFDVRELHVLPGGSASTDLVARAPRVGEWLVDVVARERNAFGEPHVAIATLAVVVRAPVANATNATREAVGEPVRATAAANETPAPAAEESPAPPARPPPAQPLVSSLSLDVPRGERATFAAQARNPASVAQAFDITLELPMGWSGSLDALWLDVPAGATGEARGAITPGKYARDGTGTLRFAGEGGTTSVRLALRVLDPAAPTDTPAEAAPEARTDSPEEKPAAPPAPAAPAPPTLRVEPADVSVARGTSVLMTLFVANPRELPIDGLARIDASPLAVRMDDPGFVAGPGLESAITFVVTVPQDATDGAAYAGVARTTLADEGVPFVVRVESALPAPLVVQTSDAIHVSWPVLAAGAGVAAAGIALAWRRWPALGLLALYARFGSERALDHPRRAAIADLLRVEPGLTLADVQRRTGLSNGVARHHVEFLEATGIVRTVPDGTLRRLWPVGEPARAVPPLRERVTAALGASPVRASELAQTLGVSKQALHYHIKRLVDEGRIVAQREQNELLLRRA